MNTNCNCPTHCSGQLSIRLEPMPVDERVAFVESVCESLVESRFGPGRSMRKVFMISEWPDLQPAAICDLTVEGPVPCYTILSESEAVRRHLADVLIRKIAHLEMEAAETVYQPDTTSNQGRGSPSDDGEIARPAGVGVVSSSHLNQSGGDFYPSGLIGRQQAIASL